MKLNKLYHALVIGGGAITTGCAGAPTQPSPTPEATPTPRKVEAPVTKAEIKSPDAGALDCSKVCTDNGSEVICPEPSGDDGATNCCWLMGAEKHPCCPK